MGRIGAFLQVERAEQSPRPASESVRDYDEFSRQLSADEQREQAARCMNCGVAFCQSGCALGASKVAVGCPLHNLVPETNHLLYQGRWEDAVGRLLLTNPFPEFTSRVCPAPCEVACNLGLNEEAVTIHNNERALADYAWEHDMFQPLAAASETAPLVSVIGSGPAGLAIAWELARKGLRVRVYEKNEKPGGLLMYGIPNMKLPKEIIQRRIDLMQKSGIEFICNTDAISHADEIATGSDAVVIAVGAGIPRDVAVEGRELEGIYFAVDYLSEVTRSLLEDRAPEITAEGKDVVVIGGGDTGVDCVACALRQGAKSVQQVIRAKRPPVECSTHDVWPAPRNVYSQGYGQREAEELSGEDPRIWSTDTIAFEGEGSVQQVRIQDISYDGERHLVEGAERTLPAQLVLIAKGFLGADNDVFEAFGVKAPGQGEKQRLIRQKTDEAPAVFAVGDAKMGSSLVATAMSDALECAEEVAELLA